MILTRSELETVIADAPDPLGLLVETNIPLPWEEKDGLPRLRNVFFVANGKGWQVPLEQTQPSLRTEVYEILSRRVFYTWNAPETFVTVQRLCGIQPAILGDVALASRMIKEPADPPPPFSEAGAELAYKMAEAYTRLLGPQRAAYELEKQVAGWLLEMSVVGYQWADRRVHPIWTTIHESGSGRIVSKQPSLSNVRKADRTAFKADPYKRWVCLRWPYSDLTMVALLSGDPVFKALVQTADPYEPLASMWGCDRDKAETIWKAISTHGPFAPRVSEVLKEDAAGYLLRLLEAAPRWQEWLSAKIESTPVVETWLGRTVHVEEPRKVHGAVVMESVSTALKMMLAFLRHESEFRREGEMAGFSSVIPLYDRVFYQLDIHVPVERHVALVKRLGALVQVGGNFATEVSMGPSWGELYPVDSEFGQTVADLTMPAPIPVLCPVCKQTALDWPTLEEHLRDAHKDNGEDG